MLKSYQKYEFCKIVNCEYYYDLPINKCIIKDPRKCIYTAKQFHKYLQKNNFEIILSKQQNSKPKVFLGGTCNNSTWRDEVISKIQIDYFNPVVDDWTSKHQQQELIEREICDFCLYVITPNMMGTYSIAEVVDDSNKQSEKTILTVLKSYDNKTFSDGEYKSLLVVSELVDRNGGICFDCLEDTINFLNEQID